MSLLESLPDPVAFQDRLGEIAREERLLRRLLPLAMRAREEIEQREQEKEQQRERQQPVSRL